MNCEFGVSFISRLRGVSETERPKTVIARGLRTLASLISAKTQADVSSSFTYEPLTFKERSSYLAAREIFLATRRC